MLVGFEYEATGGESGTVVSVVENRPSTREVKLMARIPQPTRSWCGPDHGGLGCGGDVHRTDATPRKDDGGERRRWGRRGLGGDLSYTEIKERREVKKRNMAPLQVGSLQNDEPALSIQPKILVGFPLSPRPRPNLRLRHTTPP